jgi:MOSC domain-containing protein YiiM
VSAPRLIPGWLAGLWERRASEAGATLAAIWLAEAAGGPMRRADAAEALPGRGLAGDRYAAGTGFWKATDGCQVTLIAEEDLLRAERRRGVPLASGEHRRNLVVRGLRPEALEGRRLRIGEALFGWHRRRPPCAYLDSITRPGTAKALGHRSGVCLRVLEGGWLRVGDRVFLEEDFAANERK